MRPNKSKMITEIAFSIYVFVHQRINNASELFQSTSGVAWNITAQGSGGNPQQGENSTNKVNDSINKAPSSVGYYYSKKFGKDVFIKINVYIYVDHQVFWVFF